MVLNSTLRAGEEKEKGKRKKEKIGEKKIDKSPSFSYRKAKKWRKINWLFSESFGVFSSFNILAISSFFYLLPFAFSLANGGS